MNVFYFCRLWRDLNLDLFVQTSFAPGHSAKNMIEHAWSLMSRMLVGVILPICLPGEDKPPCQQPGLTGEALCNKEATVFNSAIDRLDGYWHGKTYDGFSITSKKIPCLQEQQPYEDHDVVDKFASISLPLFLV